MVDALAAGDGAAFRAAVCAHIRSPPAPAARPARRRASLAVAG
jgi:DNA-binding GntR family transcriptional regulator